MRTSLLLCLLPLAVVIVIDCVVCLSFLLVDQGYWKSPTTNTFYACLLADQCPGDTTLCAAHRTGVLCSQCEVEPSILFV